MPVHNSGPYLGRAVDSILHQAFADLEFVIIDDASTDDSMEILRSYKDNRIVLLQNKEQSGVASSLNRGLLAAKGRYIARMDADDISLPARLARQVAFLDENESVGICGTWIRCFDGNGSYVLTQPTGRECVKAYLLLGNPLAHPSVCMRASILRDRGLRYDESLPAAQDYEFWTRCVEFMDIDNIPEPLLDYRVHRASVSKSKQDKSDEQATRVIASQLKKLVPDASPQQISFHRRIGHGGGMATRDELISAEAWLKYLMDLNREKAVWSMEGLASASGFVWFRVCHNSPGLGPWLLSFHSRSVLSHSYSPPLREKLVFWANALTGKMLGKQPAGNLEVWSQEGRFGQK